jgi:hypothetical protein
LNMRMRCNVALPLISSCRSKSDDDAARLLLRYSSNCACRSRGVAARRLLLCVAAADGIGATDMRRELYDDSRSAPPPNDMRRLRFISGVSILFFVFDNWKRSVRNDKDGNAGAKAFHTKNVGLLRRSQNGRASSPTLGRRDAACFRA